MNCFRIRRGALPLLLGTVAALSCLVVAACSKDKATLTAPKGAVALGGSAAAIGPIIDQKGDTPPVNLAKVATHGSHIDIYPYTGNGFDGTPVDPINLVFVGTACPRTVRAALMKLDGDRTAFGFPNTPPFNQRWGDAFGDVQTAYAEGEGWTGSVIQVALGDYAPIRVHLRLFRTSGTGDDVWTLGAAHFEVLIPGTADHWVLSWELARDVVVADLMRAGLVVGAPQMSGPITQTPSYRTIPCQLYNELPVELRAAIKCPLPDQSVDVPVPNDGNAAILFLGDIPDAGVSQSQSFTLNYGTVVPKPHCADGPYDGLYLEGPVQFARSTTIDAAGTYTYEAHMSGRLTATPMDLSTSPPTPVGVPFNVTISEDQSGICAPYENAAYSHTRQIGGLPRDAEKFIADLKIALNGPKRYRVTERCLEPEP